LLGRLGSVGATIAVVVIFKAIVASSLLRSNGPELGVDIEFPVRAWVEKCLERAAKSECDVMKERMGGWQENSGLYGRLEDRSKDAESRGQKTQTLDKCG
jgi:hypothetical protein